LSHDLKKIILIMVNAPSTTKKRNYWQQACITSTKKSLGRTMGADGRTIEAETRSPKAITRSPKAIRT
jgi:hypothetical protein